MSRIENNMNNKVESHRVAWVLIRFMLVMGPVILFINGFTKGDWKHAAFFAVSIAVGLTPEMLPMIVTTCLAKGAVSMSKGKTIIKKARLDTEPRRGRHSLHRQNRNADSKRNRAGISHGCYRSGRSKGAQACLS